MRYLSISVLLAVAVAPAAAKRNPNPRVLPPGSTPYGMTYAEWNAAWWDWVASIQAVTHPFFDSTGEFCDQEQSGPVWFLAPSTGDGPVKRTCTVPVGKAIFVPAFTILAGPEPGDTPEDVRAIVEFILDLVDLLEVTVDGVPLEELECYRAVTDPFTLSFVAGGLFGPDAVELDGVVAGGYAVILAPLPKGTHVIRLRAGIGLFGFEDDVTYCLTVE